MSEEIKKDEVKDTENKAEVVKTDEQAIEIKTPQPGMTTFGSKKDEKSVLAAIEAMRADMDKLKEENKEKDAQIEMLMAVADEGRKANYNAKKKIKIIPRVKLVSLNGKIVVGAKTLIDEVYKDMGTQKFVEKQIHSYTFEDGSLLDLALPEYNRLRKWVEADVVAIQEVPDKESDDNVKFYRYTVKILDTEPGGERELTLDAKHING